VARDAKKEYLVSVNSIEETIEIFFENDAMELLHDDFKRKALEFLGKHQMGDHHSNSELLNQLILVYKSSF